MRCRATGLCSRCCFLAQAGSRLNSSRTLDLKWRWMGDEAELKLENPLDQPVVAKITLSAASYKQPRPLHLTLDGTDAGSLTIAPGNPTTYQVRLLIQPGEHSLMLHANAEPGPGRNASDQRAHVWNYIAVQRTSTVDIEPPGTPRAPGLVLLLYLCDLCVFAVN